MNARRSDSEQRRLICALAAGGPLSSGLEFVTMRPGANKGTPVSEDLSSFHIRKCVHASSAWHSGLRRGCNGTPRAAVAQKAPAPSGGAAAKSTAKSAPAANPRAADEKAVRGTADAFAKGYNAARRQGAGCVVRHRWRNHQCRRGRDSRPRRDRKGLCRRFRRAAQFANHGRDRLGPISYPRAGDRGRLHQPGGRAGRAAEPVAVHRIARQATRWQMADGQRP